MSECDQYKWARHHYYPPPPIHPTYMWPLGSTCRRNKVFTRWLPKKIICVVSKSTSNVCCALKSTTDAHVWLKSARAATNSEAALPQWYLYINSIYGVRCGAFINNGNAATCFKIEISTYFKYMHCAFIQPNHPITTTPPQRSSYVWINNLRKCVNFDTHLNGFSPLIHRSIHAQANRQREKLILIINPLARFIHVIIDTNRHWYRLSNFVFLIRVCD